MDEHTPKYVAIKRSVNNDAAEGEEEEYSINIFDNGEDAAEWLTDLYEFWEDDWSIEYNWDSSDKNWIKLYNFFIERSIPGEDMIFQWEWMRKGNYRTYRVMKIYDPQNGVKFYARGKKLYSFNEKEKIVEIEAPW